MNKSSLRNVMRRYNSGPEVSQVLSHSHFHFRLGRFRHWLSR
jgi:hypothetical protein